MAVSCLRNRILLAIATFAVGAGGARSAHSAEVAVGSPTFAGSDSREKTGARRDSRTSNNTMGTRRDSRTSSSDTTGSREDSRASSKRLQLGSGVERGIGDTLIDADMDGDRDVDLGDFAFFQACVTGADAGPPIAACEPSDFDRDGDVDQADFGLLQRCLDGAGVEAPPGCIAGPIPTRPSAAPTGSQFVQHVWSVAKTTREQRVLAEMTAGNLPAFLRKFVPVTVTATIDSAPHTVTFYVMPDYLGVGTGGDFVRFPMGPRTAQAIGDVFDCSMPTRKMVNAIHTAAPVKLAPHPFSPTVYQIESVEVFNLSNSAIEQQRTAAGAAPGALVGGIKKDVVISAQLAGRPGKVAIYGWHQLNGQPIQPLYLGHDINYMDYSHGIRLVRRIVFLDGRPCRLADLLADPKLSALLSDEGAIPDPRYH